MSIPKKVHIFDCEDYSAIYFDGKLVHWYDSPSAARMLGLLGISCDWDTLPEACYNGDEPDPPQTLDELKQAVRLHASNLLKEQIAQKKRELEALENQQ